MANCLFFKKKIRRKFWGVEYKNWGVKNSRGGKWAIFDGFLGVFASFLDIETCAQRTLTPSFGCSNHFAPAKNKVHQEGVLYFLYPYFAKQNSLRIVVRGL